MKIVNGISTEPLAGKLMSALQHSKSQKLQKIWKSSLQKHKEGNQQKPAEQN